MYFPRLQATLKEYNLMISVDNPQPNFRVILRDTLEALKWIYYGPAEGCDAPDVEEAIEAAEAALRLDKDDDDLPF
jgi:hypothetical protein